MILVFGGTTEGRKAVAELEEAGQPFYYSTKTGEQAIGLHHGVRTDGAMDREAMLRFCQTNGIRLLIDAAHPFARVLHETVADVAQTLQLPAIRFERIFPPRDPTLEWIDDYSQLPTDIRSLLATTGVQSISKLKPFEANGMRISYRILNRPSSVALALKQGARPEQLCYYTDGQTIDSDAEAILLKESGLSGGFVEKVAAARNKGMRIIVLRRPPLSTTFVTVNGEHGLRRMVERLLPDFFPLKSGLTTGTCATAAAVAATRRLLTGEMPSAVDVTLPNGEQISVGVGYGDGYAYVIKESGDDPDVTNGLEVRATPLLSAQRGEMQIEGGEGVGRFTLPGFDYPPGEAAINRVPRQMIRDNVMPLFAAHPSSATSQLTMIISVPKGEEVARRTFNPRLGIVGGISIVGVSGIVKPFSEAAFIESIRKCMQVAKASGAERVVINSGAKSERFVKALYPDLPGQAFVEYGNYIGETLKIAHELNIGKVTLGVMLGKAVKLAEGQLDTHSRKGTMNLSFIAQLLREAHCEASLDGLTLARELWERLPADQTQRFAATVMAHCHRHCAPLLPDGELTVLLIDDNGKVFS